jgi:hypothetical protein
VSTLTPGLERVTTWRTDPPSEPWWPRARAAAGTWLAAQGVLSLLLYVLGWAAAVRAAWILHPVTGWAVLAVACFLMESQLRSEPGDG